MDDHILYEVSDRVAVITLNRPEVANAQNAPLLDDLDAAWTRAAADDEVRVIVLRGNGKHFSSGHDLNSRWPAPRRSPWSGSTTTRHGGTWNTRCAGATSPSLRSPRCRASASRAGCCCAGRAT